MRAVARGLNVVAVGCFLAWVATILIFLFGAGKPSFFDLVLSLVLLGLASGFGNWSDYLKDIAP